jgi:hypothetical protein
VQPLVLFNRDTCALQIRGTTASSVNASALGPGWSSAGAGINASDTDLVQICAHLDHAAIDPRVLGCECQQVADE